MGINSETLKEILEIRKDIGEDIKEALSFGRINKAQNLMRRMAFTYSKNFSPVHYKYLKLIKRLRQSCVKDVANARRYTTPTGETFNIAGLYPGVITAEQTVPHPLDVSSIYPDHIDNVNFTINVNREER